MRGRAYLTGDALAGADAHLFTATQWARLVKFDLADLADLQICARKVVAMPAVQQALKAEGLTR